MDRTQAGSEDDRAAVAAAKLSERKRLKHREYVKKSYKKKLVRSICNHILLCCPIF